MRGSPAKRKPASAVPAARGRRTSTKDVGGKSTAAKGALSAADRKLLEQEGQTNLIDLVRTWMEEDRLIQENDDGLDIPAFLKRTPPGDQSGGAPAV